MMFLLLVTLTSMLLAAIMSLVAWRIAGDERRRSEARIAALAADIHDVERALPRVPSGLSTLNEGQIAERGARMARRDDREYREYLREEQRSQPRGPQRGSRVGVERGCIAGRMQPDFYRGLPTGAHPDAVSSRASSFRARCTWDLAVASGTPRTTPISSKERPFS